MKYRRIPSKKRHASRKDRQIRRIDSERRLRPYWYRGEKIDFSSIFEQKLLGKGKRTSFFERLRARFARVSQARKRIFAFLATKTKSAWRKFFAFASHTLAVLRAAAQRHRSERKEPKDIPVLAGALVGAVSVSLVSIGVVLYTLLFSEFFGRYERVTVPDMVGMSYSEASVLLDEELYKVTLNYEYSSTIPEGSIVSQSPYGGVERKVYARGEPLCVSVTVSRGKELVKLSDYVGMRVRDVSLELKNSAFEVAVIELDEPSVPSGQVISTTPTAGSMIEVGGLVVLSVSKGEKKTMLTVPDVCGLTEASAIAKIRAAGFVLGEVEYKSSKQTAGVVISQDRTAKTKSPKKGKISITVSAGQKYPDKTMPSLYGLSIAEAKQRLAEYGLVAGNIYAVDSNEPSGSVIAQSPSASSTISPSVVSVDMYVSR